MELINALKSFLVCDLVFSITFCLGGIIEYEDDVFTLLCVLAVVATYYPLYIYVSEAVVGNSLRDKDWHFKYGTTCVYYCCSRIIIFCCFVAIALIDTAAFDVGHTLVHLPVLPVVVICILFGALVLLVLLTMSIKQAHTLIVASTLNEHRITARIIHTTDPSAEKSERYINFAELGTKAAASIYLMPRRRAQPDANWITKLVYKHDLVTTYDINDTR